MGLTKANFGDKITSSLFNSNTYYLLKGTAGYEDTVRLADNVAGTFILQPNTDPAGGTQLFQVITANGTVKTALTSDGGAVISGTASINNIVSGGTATFNNVTVIGTLTQAGAGQGYANLTVTGTASVGTAVIAHLTAGGTASVASVQASGNLAAQGLTVVDSGGAQNGTYGSGSMGNWLIFGSTTLGEGIASNRTGATNLNGLDLITNFTRRLSISNAGGVNIGSSFVDPGANNLRVGGMLILTSTATGAGTVPGGMLVANSVTSDKTSLTTAVSSAYAGGGITSTDPTYTDIVTISINPPATGNVLLVGNVVFDVTNQSGNRFEVRLYDSTGGFFLQMNDQLCGTNTRYTVTFARLVTGVAPGARTYKIQGTWVARASDTATPITNTSYTYLQGIVAS